MDSDYDDEPFELFEWDVAKLKKMYGQSSNKFVDVDTVPIGRIVRKGRQLLVSRKDNWSQKELARKNR